MKVRDFRADDAPHLLRIFREQGVDYEFPPLVALNVKVLVDDDDIPQMAAMTRPTVEAYFLIAQGPWEKPGVKAEYFRLLHEAMRAELKQQGYTDCHAWVPKQCKAFARRLQKVFGWVKSSGADESWTGLTGRV